MGISGLLPLLKDITHKTHIKQFQGKRAAIDGYVWLYKGSYSCPEELCEGRPTDKCAPFFRHVHRSAGVLNAVSGTPSSVSQSMQAQHHNHRFLSNLKLNLILYKTYEGSLNTACPWWTCCCTMECSRLWS